ncbi:unnamed protein product [Cylicocyclus nassatus]|uniref:Apple domain-containing protein n=1 Tax=Cylicocyclus nassatus TaxID=53992 RepID=A0AA36MDM8_CYLNA|nr:unnamed protein product [Cylicocyclus nassatus]
MKFAILAVLVLQVEWALPCTFQREDVLRGAHFRTYFVSEAECFARCLNHQQKCTGFCYRQTGQQCNLLAGGDVEQSYPAAQCYSLHRNSVKPPHYTRKLSFIKKESRWVVA